MALSACPDCDGQVSDGALFCPHCGLVHGVLDLEAVLAKMIPPPMLTKAEVKALTGRAQKSRQRQWLKERKIPFTLNAFGEPLLLREQLIVCYGGLGQAKLVKKTGQTEPNWAAMGLK